MSWWDDVERLGSERDRGPCDMQTSLKELVRTGDGGAALRMRRWDGRTPQRDGG